MAPALLLARLTGLELTRSTDSQTAPRRFQFSIWDMLVWMTTLAVVLIAIEYLSGGWYWPPDTTDAGNPSTKTNPNIFLLFGHILGLMLITCFSMWATLGKRWNITGILLLPVMIGLGATAVSVPRHEWTSCIGPSIVELSWISVWLVASLVVVRITGYRLTWNWKKLKWGGDTLLVIDETKHGEGDTNLCEQDH